MKNKDISSKPFFAQFEQMRNKKAHKRTAQKKLNKYWDVKRITKLESGAVINPSMYQHHSIPMKNKDIYSKPVFAQFDQNRNKKGRKRNAQKKLHK